MKPQKPAKLDTHEMSLVIREMPDASNDFLRFQAGYHRARFWWYTVQVKDYPPQHYRANYKVPEFVLLGFGATKEKALEMAARTKPWNFDAVHEQDHKGHPVHE